ncbi:MAG TPA: glutamine--fructose-6-phosphate transaminase (isomerizing) [Betaproteobacteria bacterium]|nr:glutamine--fructose-6-phosphate transaminase (isomerizing) [Betaproteobacteria bacterium]
MCGIIGAVAQRNVIPILIEGLKRLEYRGYDSAGVALLNPGLTRIRSIGRVAELENKIHAVHAHGHTGIAHTRWATHGAPTEDNAHPHFSHNAIAVVHNGIIENHETLRRVLQQQGYHFDSDTDTEVIAHLIHHHYRRSCDLLQATRQAVAELHGAFAIAVLAEDAANRLVCARRGSPLLIGVGIEEHFIASDASALLPVTQRFVYLEEGDIADIGLLDFHIYNSHGEAVTREHHVSELTAELAELGHYRHFMQKEIYEQPRAIADTLAAIHTDAPLAAELFGAQAPAAFAEIDSVSILACGTSYHAGMVARYWLEAIAGIPCTAEVASEYRYRQSVPRPKTLIVTISQSGETADTLAALGHAKALGHSYTLAICNVPESTLVRQSALHFLTRAGLEIGVASTKAFTAQLVALFLLSLVLGKHRGKITADQETALLAALHQLPGKTQDLLTLEKHIERWAERFADKHHALFLGRGSYYPIAMEGALKLKEISYIHAEAYPAGELKHGPLALIDKNMPVIAIAPNDALLEKLKSNLQEVRARGGELYVFADQGSRMTAGDGVHVIELPSAGHDLGPILHTIPLQLLAYHAALQKGTDVDKPRNLAKSVTVE